MKNKEKAGMLMEITEEIIHKVAELSKLRLTDKEKDKLLESFHGFLNYVQTMNDLDTKDVEPMTHVLPLKNVFREDRVCQETDRESVLKNAPEKKDRYFAVPKTVE